MLTVIGPLLDRDGIARQRRHVETPSGAWETRRRVWSTPSHGVRDVQAAVIPVDLEHNKRRIGKVEHLEIDPNGRLWACAMIEDRCAPLAELEKIFFSPALTWDEHDGGDVEITSVAITQHPAQLGTMPLTILEGGIEWRGATRRWSDSELDRTGFRRGMLERACETHVLRPRGAPLRVHDANGIDDRELERLDDAGRYLLLSQQADARAIRPAGRLEHSRAHGRVLAVR